MPNGISTSTFASRTPASATLKPAVPKRLLSLDALRGFDMFLIIGGTHLLETFIEAFGLTSLDWLARQMFLVHGLILPPY